jgi:hypothetical protein
MAVDAQTLFEQAKCYLCLGISQTEALQLALLAQITSQFTSGTAPPVSAPSSPNSPATFLNTATGFYYNWNVPMQQWIAVPKRYRANLSQSGTNNPVATVYENTLGNIVWNRSDVGVYVGILVNGFPDGKTWANISRTSFQTTTIFPEDPSTITVETFTTVEVDGVLNKSSVEICVYP